MKIGWLVLEIHAVKGFCKRIGNKVLSFFSCLYLQVQTQFSLIKSCLLTIIFIWITSVFITKSLLVLYLYVLFVLKCYAFTLSVYDTIQGNLFGLLVIMSTWDSLSKLKIIPMMKTKYVFYVEFHTELLHGCQSVIVGFIFFFLFYFYFWFCFFQ